MAKLNLSKLVKQATRVESKVHMLLTGPSSSGKAQPLSSLICTPKGWVPMGKIKKGDFVIGSAGNPIEVLEVYPQGLKDVYKVTLQDGSYTHCCKDHLWLTQSPLDRASSLDRPGTVRSLESIINLGLKDKHGKSIHYLPLVQPVNFDKIPLPIDPYLLGVLLGDGGFTTETLNFSNKSEQMQNFVSSLIPKELLLKPTNLEKGYFRISRKDLDSFSLNPIIQSLKSLNLWGKKSIEKFIPKEYLFTSVSDRISLLQGLLDTDGGVSGASIEFSTSSERLKSDILELVQSLGGRCSFSSRIPKYTYKGEIKEGSINYRLCIRLPKEITPFRLSSKSSKYKPNFSYTPSRYISNIQLVGEEDCQCILVDSEDHLYVTDDYILTHNTTGSLIIAKAITQSVNNKVLFIDSENGRGAHKEGSKELGDWKWDTIELEPDQLNSVVAVECIEFAENNGYEAIIIDSYSHIWEAVNAESQALGGQYHHRKVPMQRYYNFVRKVIGSKVHVLLTGRLDEKTESQRNDRGKMEVVKLGLQMQGHKNFKYEMDFVFNVRPDHTFMVDKQEGGIFEEETPLVITEQTGLDIISWLSGGEPADAREKRKLLSFLRQILDGVDESTLPEGLLKTDEEYMGLSVEEIKVEGKKVKEYLISLKEEDISENE